jgi:hypothetical protein
MNKRIIGFLGGALGLALLSPLPACDTAGLVQNILSCSLVGQGKTVTLDNEAFMGNCVVDGGTLVIRAGSTVTGNVIATNGARVTISGAATVTGNVTATDGLSLTVTDSKITGNVVATRTATVVVTGNELLGNLTVEGATTCDVSNNTVTSQVTAPNCTGAPASSGQ